MTKSKMANRYSPEVCARAVRMVFEHQGSYETQAGAMSAIAPKIGCIPQTLSGWVKQAEKDSGMRDGVTSEERDRVKAGIGHERVRRGYRVLFTRTTDIVQRLQAARQALNLAQEIARLDRFDLLILDDLSCARKDQAETSVLIEMISARYERRSIMITASQPFSGWDAVFPDKAMTVAAIDRLVHHATILEMNVESCRRRAALAAATSLSDTARDIDPVTASETEKET